MTKKHVKTTQTKSGPSKLRRVLDKIALGIMETLFSGASAAISGFSEFGKQASKYQEPEETHEEKETSESKRLSRATAATGTFIRRSRQ